MSEETQVMLFLVLSIFGLMVGFFWVEISHERWQRKFYEELDRKSKK